LGFGKYADMSIHQIFSLRKKQYLRWIYYNSSKITFIEEILLAIHIYPKRRIEKPGVDPEMGDKVAEEVRRHGIASSIRKMESGEDSTLGYRISNRIKTHKKGELKDFITNDNLKHRKGALQAKNHGH
jgi:hypothetical protein